MTPEVTPYSLFLLEAGLSRGRELLGGGRNRRNGGGPAARSVGIAAAVAGRLGPCRGPTRQPAGGARHHPAAFWRCSSHIPVPHALGFGAAAGRRWENETGRRLKSVAPAGSGRRQVWGAGPSPGVGSWRLGVNRTKWVPGGRMGY